MIFVTVGQQMPFDRLIKAMDRWASDHGDNKIFAQIGDSNYQPKYMDYKDYLAPNEFEGCLQKCCGVVAHAGTGTIIKCLLLGKPLLVIPRRSAWKETRNDHQIGTARYFASRGYILMAEDEEELVGKLNVLKDFSPAAVASEAASAELLSKIKGFINGAACAG